MYITPEYLLSHGFYKYDSIDQGDCCDIPFMDEPHFHFRQIEFHRQLFVVILSPREPAEDQGDYDVGVYVQHNVGCGFIQIPYPWNDVTVEHLEKVYEGIRGGKLNNTGYLNIKAIDHIEAKQLKS